ncbi:hypothetical protein TMatcc_010734 [Talaromyces marneffei ATCC 18224]|uniref:Uncharacterized protein n=2 Tax=Talaromyces marneffei TaxID=37727 RepID=B6QUQ1_TALMQ|nr:hypothetical protein PMAA_010080 [Talaromyces marneffei ATCC 18224]KAE8548450.1 hypothetical protein EYB25_008828 [Talaromyces marneffei]
MEQSSDDKRSQTAQNSTETRDPAYLYPETFRGDNLTWAKKLRSPVRSNEWSASMRTPVPAVVVDLRKPTASDDSDNNDSDDEDDDEEGNAEEEITELDSSTPKASQYPYRPRGPLPTFANEEEEEEEAQGEYRYNYHCRKNSVSSTRTIKPTKQSSQPSQAEHREQDVLDAMIDELSRSQREESELGYEDDVVTERGLYLKAARSLRKERRKAMDYFDDDNDGRGKGEGDS